MVDVANFAARNFGYGPDLANIDLARNRNALAQQEIAMGPLRQQALQQQVSQQAAMGPLQQQGLQQQIASGAAQEQRITQQDAMAVEAQKHQFMYAGSQFALKHPDAWPMVVQEAKNRGYIPQDFNQAYDPQKLQQYITQFEVAGLGAPQPKQMIVPAGSAVMNEGGTAPVWKNPAEPGRGANSRFGSPQIMESGRVAVLDRATGQLQYSDDGKPVDRTDKASANLQIITLPDGSQQIVDKRFGLGPGAGMAGQPPGSAPPPRTAALVAPETALAGKFNEAAAAAGGTAQGTAAAALPDTLGDIEYFRNNIQGLLSAPGLSQIYGLSRITDPRNYVPGTEASNANARLRQLSAEAFGVAIQKMRGLGQLSNAEGLKVTDAFTRAANPTISASEAKNAWTEVLSYLNKAQSRAQQKAGQGAPNPANPATSREPQAATAAPAIPLQNQNGWVLHQDAQGNKAYVNPQNPSQFEEVK